MSFFFKQNIINSEYPNRILEYIKFNIRKRLYIKKIIKPNNLQCKNLHITWTQSLRDIKNR